MVQICKENCPKPSHQTSHIRCAWHLLGQCVQHCPALTDIARFSLKRLQHSHTPLLYLLEWSRGQKSRVFQQGMQTPQHFPKGPRPPKHSPQESKLQLFQMGWGQDCSLQRTSAWQGKGGTFLWKGLTHSSNSAHNGQAQGGRLWPPTRRSLRRDHAQILPARERKGLFC